MLNSYWYLFDNVANLCAIFYQRFISYKSKPLKIVEINLVSSYYSQDGNHSPVTGGIGTEHVIDFANGLDVNWIGWDKN